VSGIERQPPSPIWEAILKLANRLIEPADDSTRTCWEKSNLNNAVSSPPCRQHLCTLFDRYRFGRAYVELVKSTHGAGTIYAVDASSVREINGSYIQSVRDREVEFSYEQMLARGELPVDLQEVGFAREDDAPPGLGVFAVADLLATVLAGGEAQWLNETLAPALNMRRKMYQPEWVNEGLRFVVKPRARP